MNLRHRAFCAYFDRAGYLRVQDMSLASLPAHRRPFTPLWAARLIQGAAPKDVTIEDQWVTGPAGDPLRLRVYRPPVADGAPRPLVLNLHGGGWVLGNPEMTEWLCGQVAAGCGAVVVSVDYRLAPEHAAPAAEEDGWHALTLLLDGAAELGLDRTRWAAFGDSAGGNLTARLAVRHRDAVRRARDAGDAAGVTALGTMRAQGLVYPVTDLTFSHDSHRRHARAPVLTAAAMHAFRDHYLGGPDSPAADNPRVSPHFEPDLAGLPPAIVTVAGLDPLADEGIAYAARLRTAGVEVALDVHPDVPHGFTTMRGTSSAARPAGERVVAFLRRHLTT